MTSWGREAREIELCVALPPFAYFSPPGFHAAIFFLTIFFRVTHDGLSERGTTEGLNGVVAFTVNG